jgi:hypothetical protein
MAPAAASAAQGLALPKAAARGAGSPKMPLPMTPFTTSAVRLQRPMTRISRGGDPLDATATRHLAVAAAGDGFHTLLLRSLSGSTWSGSTVTEMIGWRLSRTAV